jgi:hypothetical protein
MAKSQRSPINPPIYTDRETLTDYSKNIQDSMVILYQAAHDHLVLSANPSSKEGSVQTISIVDTGTSVYLVVKTNRGWFKSPAFTAI